VRHMNAAINPVQPFFLVNATHYLKRRMPDTPIVHFYSFDADTTNRTYSFAVPDGCVDMLIFLHNGNAEGYLHGFVTQKDDFVIPHGAQCFGVRFHPGYMPEVFDISIAELVNTRALISDFKGGRELLDRIAESRDFSACTDLAMSYFGMDWRSNSLLQQLIALMENSGGSIRISELEDKTNYSSRYIHKIFTAYLGVPPKSFNKFIRFQSVLANLHSGNVKRLSDITAETGYYDQAHFIKEFHEFSPVSPREYFTAVDMTNYSRKILYVR